MPSSDAPSPRAVSGRVARALVLLALSPLVYGAVAYCLSATSLGGQEPLLQKIAGLYADQGGYGFSLERFRDVEQSPPVDAVFVGSSHCYRSFDPRAFAARGLRSFNLGSSGQSPLNSYYVLKRYWPRLRPHLVILEAFPVMMANDGLESFCDLVVNSEASPEMIEMAAAVRNFQAMNLFVSTYFGDLRRPLSAARQRTYSDQQYVPGGYCESFGRATAAEAPPASEIAASDRQLDFVRRIIRFAKERDAAVAVVVQPLPQKYLRSIGGYWRVSEQVADVARQAGASFWDMNGQLQMDDVEDFRDIDHLNPSGVAKFNQAVITKLASAGLIPNP